MNNPPVYMTDSGLQRARQRLAAKFGEFEEICKERAVAHELSGDGWHDNPHFTRLQQLEADKSREIAELKATISVTRVVSIDPENRPTEAVRLGSIVQILTSGTSLESDHVVVWEIVGFDETDIETHKLAYNSPIGRALLGKEPGDVVTVQLAGGKVQVEVVALLSGFAASMPA